jgi:tRNA pseudouridine55 synthase
MANARREASAPTLANGYINLYKPPGISSMDAVRQVKRITGRRQKVGHAGTMDPLARGALPVCFGQATRLMEYLVEGTKRYQMEITLGATTATYDAEGEVTVSGDPTGLTREAVEQALLPFVGPIEQKPPMYSAVKVDGQRLYKLARAGLEVERKARPVTIHQIVIDDFSLPTLSLTVDCGKGVYMRSLAHDLGQVLGCGGYVTDLERVHCGGFSASEGVTPQQLEALCVDDPDKWREQLYPVDWALRSLQAISVGPPGEQALRNGQAISMGRGDTEGSYLEQFRAYSNDGRFLALVRFDRSAHAWQPIKVFQADTPSPFAPE